MAEKEYTYLQRDLSWLSFNERVLMEAADETVPLYNRISFLSIFSSNLDEFFRVRMPSIHALTHIKAKKTGLRDEYPKDLARQARQMISHQLDMFGNILTTQLLPALLRENIHLYYGDPIRSIHEQPVRDYFLSRVSSFLQPRLLSKENKGQIFLENNALYFIVELEKIAAPGKKQYALLNIPSGQLPRFYELPQLDDVFYLVFIDDVIRQQLRYIFPDHQVLAAWSVKITRDAELNIGDEFSGDLVEKIEKELQKRDFGHATRFLFDQHMPPDVISFLQDYFGLADQEMIPGGRYHNLKDLANLPNPAGKRLTYHSWDPLYHPGLRDHTSLFQTLDSGDKLLHLPYHTYDHILRFFNEAAIDPHVTEIYTTLYRVAAQSHIVHALISAARNGKKVVVFVELKARFDEANNLTWSKKMKAAGVRIINSIPGLKVHAKVALVKRNNPQGKGYYSLLSTGNLNETTGRFYTDHVLFTSNSEFGVDLETLFGYLQSKLQPDDHTRISFHHLLVSHFNLVKGFSKLIDREIKNARQGRPAEIIIKLNNLQEKHMIEHLYEASRAGVKISLLVRSICCAAPGIAGQSENIRICRIVDRYLEHARIFIFHNDGSPEYYMGSADWMDRNLHRRIEVCFPLKDASLCQEIHDIIQIQLNDCARAVSMDAEYRNIFPERPQPETAAQAAIYQYVKKLVEKGNA